MENIAENVKKALQSYALRSGKATIESMEDLKNCFSKVYTNAYRADDNGKPMLYRRDDLSQWAKETFERGEKFFYAEPVDKDFPYGKLQLTEPRVEYTLCRNLTSGEYERLFGGENATFVECPCCKNKHPLNLKK